MSRTCSTYKVLWPLAFDRNNQVDESIICFKKTKFKKLHFPNEFSSLKTNNRQNNFQSFSDLCKQIILLLKILEKCAIKRCFVNNMQCIHLGLVEKGNFILS